MANVFLDCDTGIDDALAIAYLKAHADTNLVGVGIVAGNTTVEFGARNTIDLLAMLGDTTTPVAAGETRFYARPFHGGAVHVHGENGVGDVALPRCDRALADVSAAQLLVDLAHEYPHDLTVLAIGPLTNLALALEIDPSIASLVSEIVIMGGALLVPGNITSHAEANIHCDPEAAEVVFAADWPVTLVPLDVTTRHRFTEANIAALAAAPSAGVRSVAEMLVSYAGFYSTIYGERVALLHDPLAAAIAVGGVSVTESIEVPLAVNVSDGELQGRTSRYAALAGEAAVSRRAATVVLDVDVPLAPVLMEALARQ